MRNDRGALGGPDASAASVGPAPLHRFERAAVLALAGGGAAVMIAVAALTRSFSLAVFLDVVVVGLFAVFLLSPPLAVALFGVATAVAFLLGWDGSAYVALSVATGIVVRTASWRVVLVFVGMLLLSMVKIVTVPPAEPIVVEIGLVVALVAGSAGLLMRAASGREQRWATVAGEIASEAERVRRDERQVIADELHDVIAHDLTVIAMQARWMESQQDPAVRARAEREIGDSARRALRDVRRLISPDLDDAPAVSTGDLEATVIEMTTALRGAGFTPDVTCELGQPLPRDIESTLARVVRESTTNVLKHGATGPVRIQLGGDEQTAWLLVRNVRGLDAHSRGLPSGGFGSLRMAERVNRLGGAFAQTATDDDWVVRVTVPVL